MKSWARTLAFGTAFLVVVAAMTSTTSANAFDEKDQKEAQKAIHELAKLLADGKDGAAKSAEVKKKFEDLEPIMHSYKPSPKGGIGYGMAGPGDSIEQKIINMGKRTTAAATLKKEQADLVKMAYINAAIADIAVHYAPAKPKNGKGAKEWKQFCADQKTASLELVKAVQAGSSEKVKAAATKMNDACNNCHADFRD